MAYSQAAIIALLNLVWEQSFGVECQFSIGDACVVGSGNNSRPSYDVLHTTGYQYINQDIDIYLKSRNAVITA